MVNLILLIVLLLLKCLTLDDLKKKKRDLSALVLQVHMSCITKLSIFRSNVDGILWSKSVINNGNIYLKIYFIEVKVASFAVNIVKKINFEKVKKLLKETQWRKQVLFGEV